MRCKHAVLPAASHCLQVKDQLQGREWWYKAAAVKAACKKQVSFFAAAQGNSTSGLAACCNRTRAEAIYTISALLHITIYILATQAEQAKASTKTSDSAAPAAIKDGDYVTLSATYKEVDDAQEGPLQPGQYGIVVGGGGSPRVNVSARARAGCKAVSWRSTIAANALPDTCALLLQSSLP